ncbi:hypothetical protein CEP52_006847 [Fusarium oligoseptatum]|uniref:Protein kinase domain-containing protein n=1 Tax=Fusarium oligoseptatum TaxID=2604345 RepID=A0A428TR49_9HYPO|nr:hypothetical protein CEP52_006847 [Fusarium oligoseptatum]
MEMATYGNARSFTSNRDLTETEKFTLCGHVASGLDFLHASGIVHGDVKQENVLVFSDDQSTTGFIARITDFERSPQSGQNVRYTGTARYNAPEVQTGCAEVEPEQLWRCDVFAFDAEQALPLALKVVEGLQMVSPSAKQTCQAILELTLPHFPAHRLPLGWQEVRGYLGYAALDIVPLEANTVVPTTDTSSYSISEVCNRINDNQQDYAAGTLWNDLQYAAATLPSDLDRGKATFSLFVCYALGSYSPCKSIEQALDFVSFAAEAGHPPALLCGKRVFEANQVPVPHIFLEQHKDPDLRKMLSAVEHVSSERFFSALTRLLLRQTVRAQQAEALGSLPCHRASQADLSEWFIIKRDEIGENSFLEFAEATLLFHHAIIRSDFAACKTLVVLGCNVNKANSVGITPLHLTVLCAEIEIFDLLLAHGAIVQLNCCSRVGLLHWLVMLPEEEVPRLVQRLLALLDDDDQRSKVCNSTLYFVLDHIALELDGSPLQWAILCRNLTLVKALTAPGVYMPASPTGLVFLAVGLGCAEILKHLLEMDSVLQSLSPADRYEIFLHLGNRGNYLTRWIMHGSSHDGSIGQVIDILQQFGIHLPLDGDRNIMSPILRAAVGNHVCVLKELLRRGLDINEHDPHAKSLLEFTIRSGVFYGPGHRFTESIQLLLSHGAKMNSQPLLHAACGIYIPLELFKSLLQEDVASLEVKYHRKTPLLELLHPPVQPDVFAKVQALTEVGSNINSELDDDEDQEPWRCCWTPLACSLYYLNWGIAEYLLDNGASLEYGFSSGHLNTILHLLIFKAFYSGPWLLHQEYSQLLYIFESLLNRQEVGESGLVNKVNHQDINVLRLSVMFGLVDIVRILLGKRYGLRKDSIREVSSMIPSLLMPAMAPRFVAFDEAVRDSIKSRKLPCYMFSEYEESLRNIRELLGRPSLE